MPIHMRMRKLRGPHMKKSMPFELFRTHTQPVNLPDLEARFEAGDEVTPETLVGKGLATRKGIPVKVLAKGELSKKLTVRAHGFSAAAREAIEAAGGTARDARRRKAPSADAVDDPQRVHGRGDPQEARLHGAAARALPARLAPARSRASTSRPSRTSRSQFGGSNILGFLNLFSGGGLSRIAVFALGIMPYITASIILQLLQVVVPSLEKLSKEGEVGQAAHHAVHALPDRRPGLRAVDRLRLPVPLVPGRAPASR